MRPRTQHQTRGIAFEVKNFGLRGAAGAEWKNGQLFKFHEFGGTGLGILGVSATHGSANH
jgi:hypothetical protein